MAYRTWRQWYQRGVSNVIATKTVVEQNWIGSNGRDAARQQRDGSDSDGSGENLDLWHRLRQYGSIGCDNLGGGAKLSWR